MPYEVLTIYIDLFSKEGRDEFKRLCEAEGWRLLWQEQVLRNDGKTDFSSHLVHFHRGGEAK